jgi:hypothetical protein
VPANRTGAPVIAVMLDYKSRSRRAAKALTPAIGPRDYRGKFSGLEPAPPRDISSIAFKRIQHRNLRDQTAASCSAVRLAARLAVSTGSCCR